MHKLIQRSGGRGRRISVVLEVSLIRSQIKHSHYVHSNSMGLVSFLGLVEKQMHIGGNDWRHRKEAGRRQERDPHKPGGAARVTETSRGYKGQGESFLQNHRAKYDQ